MAFVIADRVRETTTTIGTGSITLAGAYTSFQSFSAAIGNGNNTYYTIASASSGEWEVGIGTYSSGGNLLSRDTVLSSSNAGSLVNFSVGSKDVFVTQPSERSLLINAASNGLFAGNAAFTANGIPYANSTTTLTTGSGLTFDGATLTNGGNIVALGGDFSGQGASGYVQLRAGSSDTNTMIVRGASAGARFEYVINGSEQMRLTSTGLGIGTSSPGYKLSVNGASSGAVANIGYNGDTGTGLYVGVNHASNLVQLYASGSANKSMAFYTGATEVMRYDSSGNLGLGVTPSAWVTLKPLEIAGLGNAISGFPADAGIYVTSNAYYGSAGWRYGQTGKLSTRYSGESGIHSWSVAPSGTAGNAISFTQAMTLDASGNLGIGTSSLITKFTVQDTERFEVGGGSGFTYNQSVNAARSATVEHRSYGLFLTFGTGAAGSQAERMRLDSSGNLGLGVTPSAVSGKTFEIGAAGHGLAYRGAADINLTQNAYWLSGSWRYGGTTGVGASAYQQIDGSHRWQIAPSGTAGNAISFTQAMTLDASGNLTVGATSTSYRMEVVAPSGDNITALFRSGDATAANNAGGGFRSISSATAASRIAQLWLDADGANLSGGDYFYIQKNGNSGTADIVQYSNSAMTFATNATERARITSGGDFGIGTSSPAYKLDVNGDAQIGNATAGTNRTLRINGVVNKASRIAFQESGTDRWLIGNGAASENGNFEIYDATNGNNFVLTRTGNLGLGVTPSAWGGAKGFESGLVGNYFIGSTAASYTSIGTAAYYNGTNWIYARSTGASKYELLNNTHAWFNAASGTAGNTITFTQAMTLDASGNLGVGTTSPGFRVDFRIASAGTVANFSDGTQNLTIGTAAGNIGFVNGAAGVLGLYTTGTERARITSGGDLLVGTTSVTTGVSGTETTLTLQGNSSGKAASFVAVNNAGTGSGFLGIGTDNNTYAFAKTNHALIFGTNNTERARIDSSGLFYLGKTSDNNSAAGVVLANSSGTVGLVKNVKTASGTYNSLLNYYNGTYVGGVDYSNTATSFPTSSDVRLKKDILDAGYASEKINQIRIVAHGWKHDDATVEFGVIAQELVNVAPQAVTAGNDGEDIKKIWGVDYSKLVPMLIKAHQELKAEFDAYKATHP